MMKIRIAIMLCAVWSAGVLAEDGCSDGWMPMPRPGTSTIDCVPGSRYPQQQQPELQPAPPPPPEPEPIWETRWGAIASDPNGPLGVAEGEKSLGEAKETAINDCAARGGKKSACEIRITYKNQCAAYAWGGGIGAPYRGPDLKQVERLAIDHCNKSGGSNCELIYSGCSMSELVGYQ